MVQVGERDPRTEVVHRHLGRLRGHRVQWQRGGHQPVRAQGVGELAGRVGERRPVGVVLDAGRRFLAGHVGGAAGAPAAAVAVGRGVGVAGRTGSVVGSTSMRRRSGSMSPTVFSFRGSWIVPGGLFTCRV